MPIQPNLVPAERTFELHLDPNEQVDFTTDWSDFLNGEDIDSGSVSVTLSDEAVLAGLETVGGPLTSGNQVTVRLGVAEGDQGDSQFDPPDGVVLAYKITFTTQQSGEVRERTLAVTVVQQ